LNYIGTGIFEEETFDINWWPQPKSVLNPES